MWVRHTQLELLAASCLGERSLAARAFPCVLRRRGVTRLTLDAGSRRY